MNDYDEDDLEEEDVYSCSDCGEDHGSDYEAEQCCAARCRECDDEIDGWFDDLCVSCSRDTSYYDEFESDIKRTFERLENAGIFARTDWQCCQTCGCAAVPVDKGHKGYTFYHEQDKDSAIDSGDTPSVYLSFGVIGSADESGEEAVKVGQEISAELRKDGFTVTWNETSGQRIVVGQ